MSLVPQQMKWQRPISALDQSMSDILQNTDVSEDEKLKLYNQELQRYIRYTNQLTSDPIRVTSVASSTPTAANPPMPVNAIVSTVMKSYRPQVQKILESGRVKWDDEGRMLGTDDNPIKGTNVGNLIYGAITKNKTQSNLAALQPGWSDIRSIVPEKTPPPSRPRRQKKQSVPVSGGVQKQTAAEKRSPLRFLLPTAAAQQQLPPPLDWESDLPARGFTSVDFNAL